MTSIEPIMYEGKEIIPLAVFKGCAAGSFLSWTEDKGQRRTSAVFSQVKKDGKEKRQFIIYNTCDHQECYKEVGSQAVAYTTGVPAMIGTMMLMTGTWQRTWRI